jgi:glycosyltransferase involved in cell wall biosynthesis
LINFRSIFHPGNEFLSMTYPAVIKVLFWVCAVGAVYSYLLYPFALRLVPRRRRTSFRDHSVPSVSLIIACRNEKIRLRNKIERSLTIDYPDLEILVASDCSDDGSDEIAAAFSSAGVKLVRSQERRGKEFAQGMAIAAARGDLLVFSDAGTDIPPDAIRLLARDFEDPAVGAVSSEDQFVGADGGVVGEGAYVKYEMWLRRLESQRAGLVGLSGSFFAVRRSILGDWRTDIPSDFACALAAVRAGKIAVSDSNVRGIYKDIADPKKEYGRKVRTAIRGMTALAKNIAVLNVVRYGWFSFQVFSHKLARWLIPWCMAGCVITGALLAAHSGFYAALLVMQLGLYGAALAASLWPTLQRVSVFRLVRYFIQVNLAIAEAGVKFAMGKRVVVWEPSKRQVD